MSSAFSKHSSPAFCLHERIYRASIVPLAEIEEEYHRLCRSFAALSQWMIELNEGHSLTESRLLALNYAVQTWLQAYDEVSNDSILISNDCAVRLQLLSTLEIDHLVHFERFRDERLEFRDG